MFSSIKKHVICLGGKAPKECELNWKRNGLWLVSKPNESTFSSLHLRPLTLKSQKFELTFLIVKFLSFSFGNRKSELLLDAFPLIYCTVDFLSFQLYFHIVISLTLHNLLIFFYFIIFSYEKKLCCKNMCLKNSKILLKCFFFFAF